MTTRATHPFRSFALAFALTVPTASSGADDSKPGAAAPPKAPRPEPILPRPAPDTSGDFWHVVFDLAAGDLDGDGQADLAVSSPDSGKVLVFAGPLARPGAISPPAPTVTVECGIGAGLSGNNSALLIANLDEVSESESNKSKADLFVGNSDNREVLVFRDALRTPGTTLARDRAAAAFSSSLCEAGSSIAVAGAEGGREAEIAIAGATPTSSRVFFASGAAALFAKGKNLDLDTAASRILTQLGTRPLCENLGWDVEYADFDGDRVPELVVSSPRAPGRNGESTAGRIDVYGRTGPRSPLEPRATLFGKGPRNRFGRAFAVLDFDRDGKPDVATCSSHAKRDIPGTNGNPGSSEARNVGEVYLVPNRLLQKGKVGSSDDPAIRTLHGQEHDERFGWTILAGDFNGDGGDDLLVAGKFASANAGKDVARGRLYVVSNALLRDPRPWEETRREALVVSAPDGVRHFGTCGVIADFDGDGFDDAAIGGMSAEPNEAGTERMLGRLVILYGGARFFEGGQPASRAIR